MLQGFGRYFGILIFVFSVLVPLCSENCDVSHDVPSTRATMLVGPGQSYITIGSAVDAADPGDVIYVYSGKYNERVTILDDDITVIGNGSSSTVIDAQNTNSPMTVQGDRCVIRGFNITGAGVSKPGIGISANNVTVDCCSFYKNSYGIEVFASSFFGYGISVDRCEFISNDVGFRSMECNDTIIQHCRFIGSAQFGVALSQSVDNVIMGNDFINNNKGVSLATMCGNNEIYYNNFINSVSLDSGYGTNKWNAIDMGNYWNDWTSPDSDGDGIVDVPKNISGTAYKKDMLPSVEVLGIPMLRGEDNTTAIEDMLYCQHYYVYDTNTSALDMEWRFRTNASWLSFTSAMGNITGIPGNDDVGAFWVNLSVTDGYGAAHTNYTLWVIDVNDAPVIDTVDDILVLQDQEYRVEYSAVDVDTAMQMLSWAMMTNATFLSITGNVISGVARNSDVGIYWLNVSVTDDRGGMDYTNFTLQVIDVNDPPSVKNALGAVYIMEDHDYVMSISEVFEDVDGDKLVGCIPVL